MLADLALKSLPVERSHVLGRLRNRLLLLLGQHPGLQALEVDQAHRALALARQNQRVHHVVLLVTPADSALNVVWGFVLDVLGPFDLHGLLQLLIVELVLGHLLLVASVVLNSEPDPSQLNGVELLNFVVVFAVFVLEGPSH